MENEAKNKEPFNSKDTLRDVTPEVKVKMKKNLVYVGIFSVAMVFAGLTSGYIVSMGDSFWVKFPLPNAFYISTAFIILSSIFIQLALWSSKKGEDKKSKIFVVLTFLLGLSFVYFQFKGYDQLIEGGSHLRGNIMTVEGRYGGAGDDGRYYGYYEVKYKGQFISIDGNDYLINGNKLNASQMGELKKFMSQFEKNDFKKPLVIKSLNKDFQIFYKQQPLILKGGKLTLPNGEALKFVDLMRLQKLAVNIRDERGDFFVRGKLGKDFHVYYKGKELEYENREWKHNGQRLDDYLQTKPLESPDTASSYLWLITFLHLLHIIGTLFYMLKMVKLTLSNRFINNNTLSLKTGAIFWNFLGLLWLYLLLFLLFIH